MSNENRNRISEIGNIIVEKHLNSPVSNYKCGCSLPNRKKIIEITTGIREIIFPGFFSERNRDVDSLPAYINEKMLITYNNLAEQITLALINTKCDCNSKNKESNISSREKGEELALKFFETIPKISEYLSTDIQASFDGDPAATDKNIIISTYPGIFAITSQRIAHELYKLNIPYIPRIITEHAHSRTGIDIHPGVSIGKYFFIDHGTGIVIGETTTIGCHVKIYQGVTLGALSTKDGQLLKNVKRHPTIKDYVTIYSGASVLGGDTVIEDGVTIGGNAFVTESMSKRSRKTV